MPQHADSLQTTSPVRVLVLRGVDGAGGGADEIILRSGSSVDPNRVTMRLCFMRHQHDKEFTFEDRCRELRLDYCDIKHHGPFDTSVLGKLKRIVSVFRPDVIHSHDYKANFYNRAVTRKNGIRTVATSHGWTGNGFVERFVYYPGDRRVLCSFDRVIAVSNDIRDQLLRSGVSSNKVSVLLNGIDPNNYVASLQVRKSVRRELGLEEHDVVLGAVGRIERQKRLDLTLVAFQAIRERIPHARLLIAGEGSLKQSIQSQINQLGLSDSCRLLGHCDNMRDIFQSFDVLVQSSDYEGTPTVVVEAMALGIPIVATDAGGTAQLAFPDEHALIVPCGDTNALASAVIEALSDSEATLRRMTLARARAETELTFEHRVEQLTKIYEGLAKNA